MPKTRSAAQKVISRAGGRVPKLLNARSGSRNRPPEIRVARTYSPR